MLAYQVITTMLTLAGTCDKLIFAYATNFVNFVIAAMGTNMSTLLLSLLLILSKPLLDISGASQLSTAPP